MNFTIDKEIFDFFPGLKIVAVKARGLGEGDRAKVRALLQGGWENRNRAATSFGNPQSHPFIKPWGDRMKEVGAPRKRFPSSVEAMVRRAGKGGEPFSINNIVDFYNSITLRFLVPAGGFDIDELTGNIRLRFSENGDIFKALDSDEETVLGAGEVSYSDDEEIITRHFVYKQSKKGLLTPNTKNALFVSEILGDLPDSTAENVLKAIEGGLNEIFSAKTFGKILSFENPSFE